MPYYSFKEIWTPFKLLKIRFYIEISENSIWMKIGNQSRKRLFS
jgi:hypothetical protein